MSHCDIVSSKFFCFYLQTIISGDIATAYDLFCDELEDALHVMINRYRATEAHPDSITIDTVGIDRLGLHMACVSMASKIITELQKDMQTFTSKGSGPFVAAIYDDKGNEIFSVELTEEPNNQIIINLRFGVCKAPYGTQKEYEVSGVRKQNEDENFYKVRVGSRSRNDHHNNCFCRWSNDKLKPECIILA